MALAKRLERTEKIKAKDRMSKVGQGVQNSSQAKIREVVADKSDFGNHDTLNKAKYISQNADEEMIMELDDGK